MTTIAARETDGTIQRLDGNPSYRNPFMRVDSDQVRFPDGTSGHYAKVTSRTGLGVIAAPVALLRGRPHLGLVGQHRYPVGEHTIEFPRGASTDLGRDEAGRMLFEETGLFFDTATRIGVLKPDTGLLTTKAAVWRTSHHIGTADMSRPEEGPGSTLRWYGHGEVTDMIRDGRISCGITLAAMAMLEASGALKNPFQ